MTFEGRKNIIKRVLFQGDSITDWFRAKDREDALGSNYVTMAAGEIGVKYPLQYEFLNRAISGNRVTDLLGRVQKDMVALKPDYLSILIGINDVWHGYDWSNGVSAERYEIYYDLLISEIRESLPEIQIMILEPFVLDGIVTKGRWIQFRRDVEERAAAAKRVAGKHQLLFVPLQKKFDEALSIALTAYWLSDGVHLTAPGHHLIKNAWIEAFETLCKAES